MDKDSSTRVPPSNTNTTHKVDADGGDVALRVRVVREAQQEAGLAHARVPDQQQLEQVVTAVKVEAWCGRID